MNNPLNKPYRITSPFGWRVLSGKKENHAGIDLAAANNEQNTKRGVDILTIADGTITKIYFNEARGNVVEITHGGNIISRYQHLRNGISVKVGDNVKKGDVIAVMGNTGHCTSSNPNVPAEFRGTHLHLEIAVDGAVVNPEPYLTGAKSIGSTTSTTNPSNSTTIKLNDTVRINQGAKTYDGKTPAGFVYERSFAVDQLKGDRAVLDLKGICTAFHVKDLIKA